MSPHHTEEYRLPALTTYQQLHAAAAWAVIRSQCTWNYDVLRAKFESEFGTHLHLRALTHYLRQLKGGEPGAFNYTLWTVEAICTRTGDLHDHRKPDHKPPMRETAEETT